MANLLRAKGATDEYTKYIAPTTYEIEEDGSSSTDDTEESSASMEKQRTSNEHQHHTKAQASHKKQK
jgi:hypothetical protein